MNYIDYAEISRSAKQRARFERKLEQCIKKHIGIIPEHERVKQYVEKRVKERGERLKYESMTFNAPISMDQYASELTIDEEYELQFELDERANGLFYLMSKILTNFRPIYTFIPKDKKIEEGIYEFDEDDLIHVLGGCCMYFVPYNTVHKEITTAYGATCAQRRDKTRVFNRSQETLEHIHVYLPPPQPVYAKRARAK